MHVATEESHLRGRKGGSDTKTMLRGRSKHRLCLPMIQITADADYVAHANVWPAGRTHCSSGSSGWLNK